MAEFTCEVRALLFYLIVGLLRMVCFLRHGECALNVLEPGPSGAGPAVGRRKIGIWPEIGALKATPQRGDARLDHPYVQKN